MRAIRYYLDQGASARVHGLKNHLGYTSYAKSWALFMKIRAEKKMLAKFFCQDQDHEFAENAEVAGSGDVAGTLSE
jgi:hypothetical protein